MDIFFLSAVQNRDYMNCKSEIRTLWMCRDTHPTQSASFVAWIAT